MALEEFFVGPRKTALAPGELLLDILIPKKNLGKPADFQKFGLRKGQALALVNVAASFRAARRRLRRAPHRARRGRADGHARPAGGSLSRRPQDLA